MGRLGEAGNIEIMCGRNVILVVALMVIALGTLNARSNCITSKSINHMF